MFKVLKVRTGVWATMKPVSSHSNTRSLFAKLPLALAPVLLSTFSIGQSPQQPQRLPDGGTREILVSILIPSLPNAPFSATVNTEWIRQLADGTTITVKNHRTIARDRAGRIFQERRLLVPEDGKHESVITQIEISDPVAHKLYICKPQEGVCQLELFSAPEFVDPKSRPFAPNRSGPASVENLGKQSIGGLETEGTRETVVIETGAIGNNSPIQVTREFWYSPQLGVNLISKREDPRFGVQNFELSNIFLGDPDSKLFEPPAGVRIIDLRQATAVPAGKRPSPE
jgi:hypothetical protein